MMPTEPFKTATLECGCRLDVDDTELGHFYPCGELHHDLAARLRKPGSRWIIKPVGEKP